MARRPRSLHSATVRSADFAGHDWASRWLCLQLPAFSAPSERAYQAIWHGFLVVLATRDTDAARASSTDVAVFLSTQTKPSTVLRYARLLDRIYQSAIEWGWCTDNPLVPMRDTLAQPERRAKPSSLSTTEPSDVLSALPPAITGKERRDVAALALAVGAGLRLAEIRALRLTQIVETAAGLEVQPRTGTVKVRDLILAPPEADRVRAWLADRSSLPLVSPFVFPSKSGAMIPANTLYRRVRRLIEPIHGNTGLEHYGLGVLRATYAKQVARTHSTESTQQRLGHRRLASTRRLLDNLGVKSLSPTGVNDLVTPGTLPTRKSNQ